MPQKALNPKEARLEIPNRLLTSDIEKLLGESEIVFVKKDVSGPRKVGSYTSGDGTVRALLVPDRLKFKLLLVVGGKDPEAMEVLSRRVIVGLAQPLK